MDCFGLQEVHDYGHFFVSILLGAYSPSDFKDKCVLEVNLYISRRESGEVRDDTTVGSKGRYGNMPIYQHLHEYIKVYEESNKYKSVMSNSSTV